MRMYQKVYREGFEPTMTQRPPVLQTGAPPNGASDTKTPANSMDRIGCKILWVGLEPTFPPNMGGVLSN